MSLKYLIPAGLCGVISVQHHKNVPSVSCGFYHFLWPDWFNWFARCAIWGTYCSLFSWLQSMSANSKFSCPLFMNISLCAFIQTIMIIELKYISWKNILTPKTFLKVEHFLVSLVFHLTGNNFGKCKKWARISKWYSLHNHSWKPWKCSLRVYWRMFATRQGA